MDTIIDLVLLAILIICGWTGYKKGIIMGVGGILVIIVSVYGANLLANTFSYEVLPVMRPFANGYIESRIDKEDEGILAQLGIEGTGFSISDMIEQDSTLPKRMSYLTFREFGFSETVAEKLSTEAVAYSVENDRGIVESITEVMCARISFVGCFILAFALIVIALTVVGNITNLSFKIPGADLVNDIGGAVLGIVTGIMFCFMIAWVLKYTGIIFDEEVLSGTWLASKFMERDLLAQYIGA